MTGSDFRRLIVEALRDPRGNARSLMALPLPGNAVYEALVLVGIVSTLSLYGVAMLAGVPMVGNTPLPPPLVLMIMQVGVMLVLAGALCVIGRLFRGSADFDSCLRVIVWLQALMFLMQLAQLVVMLVLPPLGGVISLLSLVAVFWLASGLVAGVHGFRSIWLALLGTVLGLILVAFLVSILLSLVLSATL